MYGTENSALAFEAVHANSLASKASAYQHITYARFFYSKCEAILFISPQGTIIVYTH